MTDAHKILLVDDDPLVLAGFREVLSREGYAVTAVFSGREATEQLEQQSFDIVLTDLLMPRVSGLDVLKFCQEKHAGSIVIVVTGYASVRSAVDALRMGAYDYLIKPCDDQELLYRVKMGIERVRLGRELRAKELDAEKMKAIAQTAVTVNDQINTPLNVILNSAEFLRLKTPAAAEDIRQSLDYIYQEVAKIKAVIQRLAKIADPKVKDYAGGAASMLDMETSGHSEPDASPANGRRARILVVDDEQFMVHTLLKILGLLGYDVVTAMGGREALKIVLSEEIDLVVSDLHMPDMNGLELLTSVKSHNSEIPVIIVTGYGVESARESAGKWKADGFLGKPFKIQDLQKLIEKVLHSRLRPGNGFDRVTQSAVQGNI